MKKALIATGITTLALLLSGCNLFKHSNQTKKDKYTIMVYMCGSDLESGYDGYSTDVQSAGLASEDIFEITAVKEQPKDVNIIIQTGGSKAWRNGRVSSKKLGRYHVENRAIVLDEQLPNASMGKASTFQSFLEWGLTKYPAEKTGVIMWNHGGAMQGVCYDENYRDDSLLSSEVTEALKGAFKNTGRKEKIEWIGYDACLMQVQDLAESNSDYFNYMIGAQESEAGEGWEYNTWIDNVFAGDNTETVLKAICDGFIDSYDRHYKGYDNDQTLSAINLSKMPAYKSAWDDLSSSISSTIRIANKSSFQNMMKQVKCYGTSYYSRNDLVEAGLSTNSSSSNYYGNYGIVQEGQYYVDYGYNSFGTFDVVDFLNKLETNYSSLKTKIDAVRAAYNDMLVYNRVGDEAGASNGLCLYFPMHSRCHTDTYYAASETRLSSWRSFVNTLGE